MADQNILTNGLNLTPIHLAVLQDDISQLVAIIKSHEQGIDALDARRATPIMLAALCGRPTAFVLLLEHGASRRKVDAEGLCAVDYLGQDHFERLAQLYRLTNYKRVSERRRMLIQGMLGGISRSFRKKAPESASIPMLKIIAAPDPSPGSPTLGRKLVAEETTQANSHQANSTQQESRETIICQDGIATFGRLEIYAQANFYNDFHAKKTVGAIRGRAKDSLSHVMALSGWDWKGTTEREGGEGLPTPCIANEKYTLLSRSIAEMYGMPPMSSLRDHPYSSNPEERVGIYFYCHVEKQLGTWLVEEAIFRVLGTRSVTKENVSQLKEKVDMLPADLRNTVIELSHTPCRHCMDYIDLLQEQSGLVIEVQPRPWFVLGERPPPRPIDPGLLSSSTKRKHTRPRRRRVEPKDVDTTKWRQGPAELSDPSSSPGLRQEKDRPLIYTHKRQISSSVVSVSSSRSSDHSKQLESRKRQRHDFRNLVTEYIRASSEPSQRASNNLKQDSCRKVSADDAISNNQIVQSAHLTSSDETQDLDEPPEDFLDNLVVVEPFPNAANFGVDVG